MNPLLHLATPLAFTSILPEHIEPAVDALIEEANRNLDSIRQANDTPTFESTLLALESCSEKLDLAISVVRHLESVVTSPELRAAHNAVQPKVSEFYSSIPLDAAIWQRLKSYAAQPEAQALSGVAARLLTKTMDGFRRAGADLPEEGKLRLAAIDVELTLVTTKFMEHVLDSTNAFELLLDDDSQLAGLPPSAIAAAKADAESKGKPGYRFTLHAPSYLAAMTYLDDRRIREQLYRAYNIRATYEPHANEPLIREILQLRKEKASLLGYRDFSDLVLEDRMSKNGARAQEFVEDLRTKTQPFFDRENAELLAYAREISQDPQLKLEPWDIGYYAEKLRQHLYDFDEEQLRPYFSLDRVVEGMFGIVSRLYGVTITERPEVEGWHPEVKYFEIHDTDGALIGTFYSDWYPRETKRGGAWMDCLIAGGPVPGGFRPHVGLIAGNLTPPLPDRPALLTHREVETIWHEFGHLLHQLLSKVEYRSFAGTNVAWDFVELPSQIMENWCWERDALDQFAGHYQTGEKIPDELFERMKRARTFRGANAQMRQLSFALLDLKLHREYEGDEPVAFARAILNAMSAVPLPSEHAMLNGFAHLFSSPVAYASGYYSYKWAEVLDADAFTRFKKEGIFSPETGAAFKNEILSRGNSEDPDQLFRNFMGRDPDPDALLVRSGLLGEAR